MKKLFILLIGVLIFASCCPSDNVNKERAKLIASDQLVRIVFEDGTPYSYIRVMEFEYKGHKYLQWGGGGDIIHHPDCHCVNKMLDEIKKYANSNSYYSSYSNSNSSIWD